MNPVISIVVPNFNREDLISETIDSVVRTASDRWELLVVDDHSSDTSLNVAASYAAKESKIQCWTRKSTQPGAPACRNEGAKHSQGRYLIFLDSDDLLSRECIVRRLEEFEKRADVDFLVFPGEKFDRVPGDLGERWFTASNDSLSDFLAAPAWQTSAVIWRKESFDRLGGFREDLISWQDWDLHVRAIANGFSFQLVEGAPPDHFVRRGHVSRISSASEVKIDHLTQRKSLFEDTVDLLRATANWNQNRQDLMIRRFVILAIQLYRADQHDLAEEVMNDIKKTVEIDENTHSALQRYFSFEVNSFYRRSLLGKLIRPFFKQYYRFQLGACVIQRVR